MGDVDGGVRGAVPAPAIVRRHDLVRDVYLPVLPQRVVVLSARAEAAGIHTLLFTRGAGPDRTRLLSAVLRRSRMPSPCGPGGPAAPGSRAERGPGRRQWRLIRSRQAASTRSAGGGGRPGLTYVTLGVFSPARLAEPQPHMADCPSCSVEC
ncbi:hypothetical protein AQI70_19130 [Streptomyces curacoi]|uniref:Uncharacterized protein n=1 Tax=Streptomyces curacoi TaxID=146536 RepID=A0A124H0G0_9ACTN|nr:hypothetical protein AQI70_19130 [Streptomyces curacoi]